MHDYNYYRWVIAEYNMPEEVPFNAHHKDFFRSYTNHGLLSARRKGIYYLPRDI
jgi:hypothetical protein